MLKKLTLRKLAAMLAMTAMMLVVAVPALAQDAATDQYALDETAIQGTITEISGSVVVENTADESVILVEEDHSDWADPTGPPSVPTPQKGFFRVTDETEILDQRGEEQTPAMFEDLEVGQVVEATYLGPVAASYPQQGTADSIMILEGTTDPAEPDPSDPGNSNGVSDGSFGGMNVLPDTGGPSAALLGSGVLAVIVSGLLARRFVRRR